MTLIEFALPLPEIRASEDAEDGQRRSIKGRAVPWETEALTSTGQRVTFAKGSVTMAGVPVVLHHLPDRPVGIVAEESSADDGLDVDAKISAVRDGDEALILAQDGVLRGWSVGVNPTEFEEREDGSLYVTASDADHLALVMRPAFSEAQVTKVAAAAAKQKEDAVTDTATVNEQPVEAPAVVAAAPRTPARVQAGLPPVGVWMKAVSEAKRNPEQFAAVQARIQAATGHVQYDPNLDGWAETPYVGQLIDIAQPAARPLSTALGISAAPSGVKSFLRPTLSGHLAAAATAAEKSDVTDDGLNAGADQTVTMTFLKRAANVSAEAQVFSSPDVYALVARDLVRAYLLGFEAHVVAALEGGTYTTATIAVDGSDAVGVLSAAAGGIAAAVYQMPDTLLMAPDVWAKVAGFTATDGRSLFPYLAPSNAAGQNTGGITSMALNVLGLRPVIVPTLSAGKAYLMSKDFFEVYESSRVNMGPVQDPTVLGTAWGIGGAVGTNLVDAGGIQEVAIAAA